MEVSACLSGPRLAASGSRARAGRGGGGAGALCRDPHWRCGGAVRRDDGTSRLHAFPKRLLLFLPLSTCFQGPFTSPGRPPRCKTGPSRAKKKMSTARLSTATPARSLQVAPPAARAAHQEQEEDVHTAPVHGDPRLRRTRIRAAIQQARRPLRSSAPAAVTSSAARRRRPGRGLVSLSSPVRQRDAVTPRPTSMRVGVVAAASKDGGGFGDFIKSPIVQQEAGER